MWHFSQGPSNLHLGSGFGNLTTLQNEDFHILQFVLCGQADETIQHTLVACVFARQVWTAIFHVLGLLPFAPQPEDSRFSSWWSKDQRKGLTSLIILVLGKFGNIGMYVFEDVSPCAQKGLAVVSEECILWCWTGAKSLQQQLCRSLLMAA